MKLSIREQSMLAKKRLERQQKQIKRDVWKTDLQWILFFLIVFGSLGLAMTYGS